MPIGPIEQEPATKDILRYLDRILTVLDHPAAVRMINPIHDRLRAHPGVPAQITLRSFLAVVALNAIIGENGTDRSVRRTAKRIPRSARRDLDLIGADGTVSYKQFNHFSKRLIRTLEAGETGLSRHGPIVRMWNQLLSISLWWKQLETDVAVDWTYEEAWARQRWLRGQQDPGTGRKGNVSWCKDDDARRGRIPPKNAAKEVLGFIWYPHFAVTKDTTSGRLVIAAFGLSAGNTGVDTGITQILSGIRATNDDHPGAPQRIRRVLADRGYTSKPVKAWAGPVADAGLTWIGDRESLRPGGHAGKRSQVHSSGYQEVDGALFCPHMPETIVNLPLHTARLAADEDGEQTNEPSREALADRYDQRLPYLATPRQKANGNGKTRYECPARRGTVRCPGYPPSMRKGYDRPSIEGPVANSPCCAQETVTVTVNDEDLIRVRQDLPYGTTAWLTPKGRRSWAESINSVFQGARFGVDRHYVRAFGLSRTDLAHGAVALAINLTRDDPPDS